MTTREIALIGLDYSKGKYFTTIRKGRKVKYEKTAECDKIESILNSKVFRCPDCGNYVSYFELIPYDKTDINAIANHRVSCNKCFNPYSN